MCLSGTSITIPTIPLSLAKASPHTHTHTQDLLLAGLTHVCNVGEEVVVLGLGHGVTELR